MISLPSKIKPLSEIEEEYPELVKVMKKYATGYEMGNYVIVTQSQICRNDQVYGIFLVDTEKVEKNSGNFIVQDYLVLSNGKTVVYYSGGTGNNETKEHQHINKFFDKYSGENQYYGRYEEGKWVTDHRYKDTNDPKLPGETWFRNDLKEKIDKIRKSLTQKL